MTTRRPLKLPACFAPPADAHTVDGYLTLAETAPAPVRDAMRELVTMLHQFQKTGRSPLPGRTVSLTSAEGRSHTAVITPLEQKEIDRIFDFVPWEHELDGMGRLFDSLPKGELRHAAYHLLWYGRELVRDREPMTR